MSRKAISDITWKDLEKELFTPEEIAESNEGVAMIGKTINAIEETNDKKGDDAS